MRELQIKKFQVRNDIKDFVIISQVRSNNFPRAYDLDSSNGELTNFFKLCDADAFRKFCIVHRAVDRDSLKIKVIIY